MTPSSSSTTTANQAPAKARPTIGPAFSTPTNTPAPDLPFEPSTATQLTQLQPSQSHSPPRYPPQNNLAASNRMAPGDGPSPKQQAPDISPVPEQAAASQIAANPPRSPSTPIFFPGIIPMNAQASAVSSMISAAAIPVLVTLINADGQPTVSTTYFPGATDTLVIPMSQAVTSTNALGSTFILSRKTLSVLPISISTNPQGPGTIATSISLYPMAMDPPASPIALVATPITTTDARGISIVSSGTAALVPVLITSTNAQGQIMLSTSLTTAAVTASINVAFTSTDAGGQLILTTTQLPAIVLTTTNAQGSQVLTTLSIYPSMRTSLPILKLGTYTVAPNPQPQYIIGSQTLTPNGAIMLSGTPIYLAPSATRLVIGSSTIPLENAATVVPALTIGEQVVTANSRLQNIGGSQTLIPGEEITVSGMPVSLAPGGTQGVGGLIMVGLGNGPSVYANTSVKAFTGVAAHSESNVLWGVWALASWRVLNMATNL